MIALPPMVRLLGRAALVSAVVAGLAGLRADAQGPTARESSPATTDGMLASYLSGDASVVDRLFKNSLDFQNRLKLGEPKEFDRWLGEFDPAKAVFILSLAKRSALVGRQYTPVLLRAGGKYVDGLPGTGRNARPGAQTDFARAWHRAALALLQGLEHGAAIEEHLAAIELRGRRDVTADSRLLLARGVAQEMRCWMTRPSLNHPSVLVAALAKSAGIVIEDDLDGPTKAGRMALASQHFVCLNNALERFDAARTEGDARIEAGVRGGWVLVQQARYQDALAWLDVAVPESDQVLLYWRSLFRARALSGLNRHREASEAYRDAFARFPGAQTAGLGLAFELLCLDRDPEADQIARGLRATAATAVDPWTAYLEADGRFAGQAVEQLRKRVVQ